MKIPTLIIIVLFSSPLYAQYRWDAVSCSAVESETSPLEARLQAQIRVDVIFGEQDYLFSLCSLESDNLHYLIVDSIPLELSAFITFTAQQIPNELFQIQNHEIILESWLLVLEEAIFSQLIDLVTVAFSQWHEDTLTGRYGSRWCVALGEVLSDPERVCYRFPSSDAEERGVVAMSELGRTLWELAEFEWRDEYLR